MNNLIKIWTIIGIYFFFSCNLNVIDSENTNNTINNPVIENTSETSDDNSGRIILHIPMIPDLLGNTASSKNSYTFFDKDSKSAPLSKALGFATDVEVIISQGATVIQTEFIQSGETEPNLFEGDFVIPIGTGYTAQVNIYNSFVSEAVPVVTGTSDLFDITARNTTNVSITALPYNPTIITSGPTNAITITGAVPSEFTIPQSEDDEYQTTFGSEYWFEISSCEYSSTEILITHEQNDSLNGFVSVRVYDDTGHTINSKNSRGLLFSEGDKDNRFLFPSQIGAQYFVRVIPLSVTHDNTAEFTIKYLQGPDDDTGDDGAGNDTAATAMTLSEGVTFSAYLYDADYYTFSLSQETQIIIETGFSHLDRDCEVELRNADGTTLISEETWKFFTGNIIQTLDAGDYIIKVMDWDYTFVYPYEISWHAYIPQPANDDTNKDNDTFATATPIQIGDSVSGICDDLDYYFFSVPNTSDITITCQFLDANGVIDMSFFDSSYNYAYGAFTETNQETRTLSINAGETYYICIYPFDVDFTPYTLSLELDS